MGLALEAIRVELDSHIVAARQKRNGLVPIFRLPEEVLVNIFHISLESHLTCGITDPPYLDRLKKLASVCSSWLTLVRSTPSLWAVLEASCPITFLPVVLRNSKSSLLNIRSEWGSNALGLTTDDHRKFLQAVIEPALTERWSSVYIDLPHETGPIKKIMEGSFPNLRSVYFGPATWRWQQGPVNLLGGDTGRLKELRLKGVPLQWDAISLSGLRLLELKLKAPDSSAKLLDLLAAAPSLESLTLTGLPRTSHSIQYNLNIIDLPHLKDLVLVDNEVDSIIPLLQSIRVPTLNKLRITYSSYNQGYRGCGNDFVSALSALGHIKSVLQSAADSATNLDLAVGRNIQCIAKRGSEVCLEINLFKTRSSKVLECISEAVKLDPKATFKRDTELTLNPDWDSSKNTTEFLPVMEWFGDITELVLNDDDTSTEVLKWLSERVVEGDEVGWRYPRLRKLSICGRARSQDVIDFAVKRYGGSKGDGGVAHERGLTVYWPDHLECLDLTGLHHRDHIDMTMNAEHDLHDLLGLDEIIGYGRRVS